MSRYDASKPAAAISTNLPSATMSRDISGRRRKLKSHPFTRTDAERSPRRRAEAVQSVDRANGTMYLRQKGLALIREEHASRSPPEQTHPEISLESGQSATERRSGDVELGSHDAKITARTQRNNSPERLEVDVLMHFQTALSKRR